MRIGKNPAKSDTSLIRGYGQHRIIIPVYIPNLEGYFKNALEITLLSLESLYLTAGGQIAVTVISNGSCEIVVKELIRLYESGRIEQLLLDHDNRGKVNATLAAARGSYEPFITIADSDMLYLSGWLQSVQHLFEVFPECGFVAPGGMPRPRCRYTSATIIGAFLKRELNFKMIISLSDIKRHGGGLREHPFLETDSSGQLIVRRGETEACVGGSHMIFTIRREVLSHLPSKPIMAFHHAEKHWIDIPVDVAGYWRLSPARFLVCHMGNTPAPWMYEEMSHLDHPEITKECSATSEASLGPVTTYSSRKHWSRAIPWYARVRLSRRIRQRYVPQAERKLFEQLR